MLPSSPTESAADTLQSSVPTLPTALSKTAILGFSKGGTVVNQILSELAHFKPVSAATLIRSGKPSSQASNRLQDHICPDSKEGFLCSISEFHYVDVGLNRSGAYLTDDAVICKAVENLVVNHDRTRFVLHGTPRQWCDHHRPWICKEKDMLLRLLEKEARRWEGKLQVTERFYFGNTPPSLRMHFEVIEVMDVS